MSHRTSIKVRFYELDPYDHVNHAAYVQYFEVARIELLDEIGMGIGPLLELGYQLVVGELSIRYLAPAGSGDLLEVETEVAEIRRASSRWRQAMRRHGELIAHQEIVVVATDLRGRPVRVPPGMGAALEPYLAGD
jgi:acyl-CoA thioester hydrolase